MELATTYKAIITKEQCIDLINKLYGVKVIKITELNGYDDKNFKVFIDSQVTNNSIEQICLDGYVFKVMNSMESRNIDYIDAQNKMMHFLRKNNIKCPAPTKNLSGEYFSIETINHCKHCVRLLEYQSGEIFHDVPKTNELFYQAGLYIANLDLILKGFKHPVFATHKTIWMLESVPEIKKYLRIEKDPHRKQLINEILFAFKEKVLQYIHLLEKGIIHGDYNDQNILVEKTPSGEWKISGILDFGDSHYSCYLFEVSIAIMYALTESKNLDTIRWVLAGYTSIRKLTEFECSLLKYCIAARFIQSLILGAFAHTLDVKNDYILQTQKPGWQILDELWNCDVEALIKDLPTLNQKKN